MRSYVLAIAVVITFCVFGLDGICLAAEHQGHEHDHSGFSLHAVVKPLGIATLSFVTATFVTGLLRKKLGRRYLKIHLPLAITSVVLGFTHATLVFILFG